jgi:ABC-type microcin C transport system permease subunit YejE
MVAGFLRILAVASVCHELATNDKPIRVEYKPIKVQKLWQ